MSENIDFFCIHLMFANICFCSLFLEDEFLGNKETLGAFEVVEDVLFADQSYSIQKRLEKLDEKILNKTQALTTLKNSIKNDAKVSRFRIFNDTGFFRFF